MTRLILVTLVKLALAGNALASSISADASDPRAIESFVDAVVPTLMRNHNSPSGTVTIIKDGRLMLAKGYGFQDMEKRIPVDPHRTLFRPGSISKLFTWVAVMQLVEQGKLSLDEDVNTYLKGFRIRDTFKEPITLRHMMTHTAGFEDGNMGFMILQDPKRMISLQESMKRFQPKRVNPPGAQTAYSNYGAALAGLIVETISGQPFNVYIAKNIFGVLQMSRSTFEEPLPALLADDMAVGYVVSHGQYQRGYFEILSRFGPAGALSATSTDMIRFAQALLQGGELDGRRILQAGTLERMMTRAFSHDDRLMGMGLGFYERDMNGHRIWGHAGAMLFFHSDLVLDPRHDLAFFTSFGATGGAVAHATFSRAFYDYFYPAEVRPAPVPPADFADRGSRFEGTYLPWRANFSTVEKTRGLMGDGLQVIATVDALLLSNASGSKRYVEVGPNLFREGDPNFSLGLTGTPRQVAFQEGKDGEITGLVLDGRPFTSSYRASFRQTGRFSRALVAISGLMFVLTLLEAFCRRASDSNATAADRRARRVALFAAGVNIAVLILGASVMSRLSANPFGQLSASFRAFVWLPLLVVTATAFLLFQATLVWKRGLLAGWWERARYSVLAVCSMAMCWFYAYWHLIGPQYLD